MESNEITVDSDLQNMTEIPKQNSIQKKHFKRKSFGERTQH